MFLCSLAGLWLRKEEPPSCSPNQDFMTGFIVQVSITQSYCNTNSASYSSVNYTLKAPSCSLSFDHSCILKFKVARYYSTCFCVCFVQGHRRAGEVQDHYDSLLQRSHGEHRTPTEQADWIIRLTSLPPFVLALYLSLTP